MTPLGTTCEVAGVKYKDPKDVTTARLILRYPSGAEIPVEQALSEADVRESGYYPPPEGKTIQKDISLWKQNALRQENVIKVYAQNQLLRMESLLIEGTLRHLAEPMVDRLRRGPPRAMTAPAGNAGKRK